MRTIGVLFDLSFGPGEIKQQSPATPVMVTNTNSGLNNRHSVWFGNAMNGVKINRVVIEFDMLEISHAGLCVRRKNWLLAHWGESSGLFNVWLNWIWADWFSDKVPSSLTENSYLDYFLQECLYKLYLSLAFKPLFGSKKRQRHSVGQKNVVKRKNRVCHAR